MSKLKTDTMTFGNNVGVLSWCDGRFDFKGDATESAKLLIEALSEMGIKICGEKDKRIAELESQLRQITELVYSVEQPIGRSIHANVRDIQDRLYQRDLEQQAKGLEDVIGMWKAMKAHYLMISDLQRRMEKLRQQAKEQKQ